MDCIGAPEIRASSALRLVHTQVVRLGLAVTVPQAGTPPAGACDPTQRIADMSDHAYCIYAARGHAQRGGCSGPLPGLQSSSP